MKASIQRHPLILPLTVGLLLRLAAAVFGGGYLMHDDHFLVVEVAASWADGEDYNNWLPWSQRGVPEAHPANFAYPVSQYLLFELFHKVGPHTPQGQALLLRILHGLYSLATIVLGYLMARAVAPGQRQVALRVAWILAAGGLWPLLGVHQLVEMVCIPPLMLALWVLSRHSEPTRRDIILAGIGIGIATGLRYQCGMFGIGLVPVLLAQRRMKDLLGIGLIALGSFTAMQAPDLAVWGRPFVQLQAYIAYNSTHAGHYPTGPWYQYILTMVGLLIPPVSLMLLWGAAHRKSAPQQWWRIAVPVLCFLVFHSAFINKQERFILPAIPAVIVLGTAGWSLWSERSKWWNRHRMLERGAWGFFWLTSILLVAVTIPYSGKHTRVAAMTFLYEQGAEDYAMVQVDSGAMPPQFYSGSWRYPHVDNRREAREDPIAVTARWCAHPPQYILFQGDQHLGEAVAEYKAALPGLRYITTIKPSRIDRWIHELNPINSVERIMVYATDDALPCP